VGVFNAFGLLFLSFGNLVQKFQDVVRGNAFDAPFSEILVKPGEKRFVCLNRIFFVNWTCGNPARVFLLVCSSFLALLVFGLIISFRQDGPT